MKKIPTMFERDETQKGHPVKPIIKPECSWVQAGEGVATRKLDGTNVKIHEGCLYKRQKPKSGVYDEAAYVLCERGRPDEKYLWEAFDDLQQIASWPDGIYEAIGPKIQGNPEQVNSHQLVRVFPSNAFLFLPNCPLTFESIRDYLSAMSIEGVVFHHHDGRMAKIKRRDFGLKWPI